MITVQIYAIINPSNDDVLYIGASRRPKLRYTMHSKGVTWSDDTYRKKELLKMKQQGVEPELLIVDTVEVVDVGFFEEFYMELFKSWGYTITQQKRSGYQTWYLYFRDNTRVHIPLFRNNGTVIKQTSDIHVHVLLDGIDRTVIFSPLDLEAI